LWIPVILVLGAFPIDRPRFRPGSREAALVALALTAVATLLRLLLGAALAPIPFGGLPFATFFAAVIATAFLCGSVAAIIAAVASMPAAWLFVFPAQFSTIALYQTIMFGVGAATVIGVVAAMRAASAKLRRLNENLRRSEGRLADASRAKSEFIARMSHEIRTPLNAIIGFSEMIRDAMIGPLDARYRGYGADINDAGRHLQKVINDILDMSKIEGGRLERRDEPVAIAETVDACRRIVAAMADAAGVSLTVAIQEGLPPIFSDALRLRQILLNLMSNAVKFTPAGGTVRVSAAIAGDCILVAVADTGIGMRPEEIALALEPFRQLRRGAGDPFVRRFDGTGLGLPLAKALVELHGGTLDIESALDAGTTVRVRLPLKPVAEIAA
jgi:signal transduction histidine kinase